MDQSILEDLGLSKTEIAVYLSLLELGSTRSGALIRKSQLQSSVVHRALNSLLIKGIISYVLVGKNRIYQATEPRNLVQFIELKKKKFLAILPELEAKQKFSKKQDQAEIFIGKKAIFSLLNSLIKDARKGEEFLSFSLIDEHNDENIIRFYKQYNLLRQEKRLDVKVLVNKKVKGIYESQYSKNLLKKANVRYTSFSFPQGIVIFRDTLLLLSFSSSPSAIKISSAKTTREFREFFLEFYEKETNAY